MSLLKKLFGSAPENPEEEKKAQEAKNFDVLKYDGVAALRQMSLPTPSNALPMPWN
jgi:hypothetical protein